MTAPDLAGYHHATLTVSDLDAALAWYSDVLGFEVLAQAEADGIHKAVTRRGPLFLTFVDHGEQAQPGDFTERRVGLDHLALAVTDADALQAWIEHLDAKGISHSAVTASPLGGQLITFRDPDNIALELYTLS